MCLLRIFMEQTLDCIYATMSCANLTDTGLWIGSRIHQWPITQFIWSVPSQFIDYCSIHYINKIYTYHICAFYVNNKIKDDFSSPIWYILTIVFGWLDSEVSNCVFYVNKKIKDDFSLPIWYILTIVFGWLDSEVNTFRNHSKSPHNHLYWSHFQCPYLLRALLQAAMGVKNCHIFTLMDSKALGLISSPRSSAKAQLSAMML